MNTTCRLTATVLTAAFSLAAAVPALGSYYSDQVQADNPVAYWRLGETSGTTAINAINPGTYNGTISSGVTLGVPGGLPLDTDTAFNFDSAADAVTVAYDPSLNPTSFSVEFWARVTGRENEWRGAIFNRTNDSTGGYGFNFYASDDINATINNNWSFWVGRDKQSAGSGGDWASIYDTTQRIALGQWYYVVGTYDETTNAMRLYVDGSLVATSSEPYFRPKSSGALSLGLASSTLFFHGDLDEVALYDYVLAPEQIAAHYAASVPEPGTLTLLALGALGVAAVARRRWMRRDERAGLPFRKWQRDW